VLAPFVSGIEPGQFQATNPNPVGRVTHTEPPEYPAAHGCARRRSPRPCVASGTKKVGLRDKRGDRHDAPIRDDRRFLARSDTASRYPDRGYQRAREAYNVMLPTPRGVDPLTFQRAVREFASQDPPY
jgi:hypothetical protein